MTRGNIDILQENKIITRLFISSDMYPSGVMRGICEQYKNYHEVNGIQLHDKEIYNGINDFIGQLIWFLKDDNRKQKEENGKQIAELLGVTYDSSNEAGWLYVYGPDDKFCDTEYNYNIYSKEDRLCVSCTGQDTLFEGTMEEYIEWVEQREED